MNIGGVSVLLISGIVNYTLILFQISSGKRWIKVPFGVHRKTGILLLITASIHAVLAIFAQS